MLPEINWYMQLIHNLWIYRYMLSIRQKVAPEFRFKKCSDWWIWRVKMILCFHFLYLDKSGMKMWSLGEFCISCMCNSYSLFATSWKRLEEKRFNVQVPLILHIFDLVVFEWYTCLVLKPNLLQILRIMWAPIIPHAPHKFKRRFGLRASIEEPKEGRLKDRLWEGWSWGWRLQWIQTAVAWLCSIGRCWKGQEHSKGMSVWLLTFGGVAPAVCSSCLIQRSVVGN